jgi:hypothetical protein
MRRFFQFWRQCCGLAFKGNSSFANGWQWMFGTPFVTAVGAYLAARSGVTELTTGYPILDAFVAALAAFIITWFVAFCVRLLRVPVNLVDIQIERTRAAEARLLAMARPYPDWPIHELFTHIRPDLLDRVDKEVENTWDRVGNDVRDQAALGRLKTWGRAVRSGADKTLGQRETLRLIETSYWTDAFFTYSFFDNTAVDAPHTYLQRGRSGPEYTDLHVNQIEALSIWPKSAT